MEEKLKEIIENTIGINKEEITLMSSFDNDLGLDSLDVIELVMAVEKYFNIYISDDEISKIYTVKDAVELLEDKIA